VNFDKRYPEVETGFEPGNVFKTEDVAPCSKCGTPTVWVEISFEAHVCSEECQRLWWDEYLRALRMPPSIESVT
jgi:endogenous inhibitor of DNA gyrase (YacG/DUF329 family)